MSRAEAYNDVISVAGSWGFSHCCRDVEEYLRVARYTVTSLKLGVVRFEKDLKLSTTEGSKTLFFQHGVKSL